MPYFVQCLAKHHPTTIFMCPRLFGWGRVGALHYRQLKCVLEVYRFLLLFSLKGVGDFLKKNVLSEEQEAKGRTKGMHFEKASVAGGVGTREGAWLLVFSELAATIFSERFRRSTAYPVIRASMTLTSIVTICHCERVCCHSQVSQVRCDREGTKRAMGRHESLRAMPSSHRMSWGFFFKKKRP